MVTAWCKRQGSQGSMQHRHQKRLTHHLLGAMWYPSCQNSGHSQGHWGEGLVLQKGCAVATDHTNPWLPGTSPATSEANVIWLHSGEAQPCKACAFPGSVLWQPYRSNRSTRSGDWVCQGRELLPSGLSNKTSNSEALDTEKGEMLHWCRTHFLTPT